MKIDTIFTLVPGSLYSAKFVGEPEHEFWRIFRLWNDMEYLEGIFEEHYRDLLGFWDYMEVSEAAEIIFRPLHRGISKVESFEKSKARGFRRQSWLRVYAVRIDVNKFVISGGAIKLNRTMNEREHLVKELIKMEKVCQFLKEDQKSELGLFELF